MEDWAMKKKDWKKAAGYKIESVEMPAGPKSFPMEKLQELIYGINKKKEQVK